LPLCDDKGRGPSCDVAHNAIKLLRRLAYVHYHPPSQYTLGNLFITGLPDNVRNRTKKHKPDYARAFELWIMAAKRNHADATYNVALCTERGLGTRSSARRAADFYRKAAVLNHPGAMTRLGTALLNGDLGLAKSPRDAVKWLRIALKYADTRFPRVCVELSKLHASGVDHVILRDDDYAFELLKRGSELGDPEAQHRLGRAYELGRMHPNPDAAEITTPNPKIAIQLYQAAANQGHADAMLEISGWYLTGWPRPGEETQVAPKRFGREAPFTFPQSDELAYKWARQAAEKGLGRGFYVSVFWSSLFGFQSDSDLCFSSGGRLLFRARYRHRNASGPKGSRQVVRDGCEKGRQRSLEKGPGAGRQDVAVLDDLAQQLFHLGIGLLVKGALDHVFGTIVDVLDLELSGCAKRTG
jgi:TPR repeat protein